MKNFFAFKDVVYGAAKAGATDVATNPHALADGAVGLYKETKTGIALIAAADAAATLADVKRFIIARGTPKASLQSQAVLRTGIKSVNAIDATPGQKTVYTVTSFNPSLPAGSLVELNLSDTSSNNQNEFESDVLVYKTKAANETATVQAAGLATEAGLREGLFVTATAATGTLTLTHVKNGKTFAVRGQGGAENVIIARTQIGKIDIGDYTATRNMELELEGYDGRTDYIQARNLPLDALSQVAAGTTYDITNILWENEYLRRGVESSAKTTAKIVVAFPDVADTAGNSAPVFRTLLGLLANGGTAASPEPATDAA